MFDKTVYKIKWDIRSVQTYLHGSVLEELQDGSTYFENEMLYPGCMINEWTSFTNFQRDRREPQLPLVLEGHTYRVQMHCSVYPEGTLLWKVDFYDAQDQKLQFKIFDTKTGEFTVPDHTYSYKIQLIEAGLKKISFDHFTLEEV